MPRKFLAAGAFSMGADSAMRRNQPREGVAAFADTGGNAKIVARLVPQGWEILGWVRDGLLFPDRKSGKPFGTGIKAPNQSRWGRRQELL
jgi:hypothetical protein